MKSILELFGKEWVYFDGGSGTLLQKMGLQGGELPEQWNISRPEAVRQLYTGYLEAGAKVFNTNTFGANRFHYGEDLEDVIRAGVRLAEESRKACGREDAYIALDIGPSGKLLEPMGDLSFDEAVETFAEIVRYGMKENPDVILIETMSDSYEAKAALLAAKENSDLPVFVTCTFDAKGRLLTGGTVESLVPMLEGLGADAVGINCSLGPKEMVPMIRKFLEIASVPVIVNPNAGLPETRNGRTVYSVQAGEFAQAMAEIAALGVQGIGGCCGTTPDYIRKLIAVTKEIRPGSLKNKQKTVVTSFSQAVEIGGKTKVIGERINPTGKKRFQQALRNQDIDYILSQALEQEEAGADILDVNVGLPEIDEVSMMETVIKRLQGVTSLPLQIDSSDPEVLSRALRIYNGKPMINSVNGKEESMRAVFPLAKKYGAAVVALCLDEKGIPETAEERIRIARRIIDTAASYGIDRSQIILDGLTMAVSSDSSAAVTTLETIRMADEDLHCATILGVSNVSFGLPQRSIVNSYFLSMAMRNGLSCAIINPNNNDMMVSLKTSNALLNKDPRFEEYISAFAGIEKAEGVKIARTEKPKETSSESIAECIEHGLSEKAVRLAHAAVEEKKDLLAVINEELIPALDKVGKGFEKGTVYLPQLLMSADTAKAVFSVFRPAMRTENQEVKGTVILATVKGDIHDIGKNIVKVMLENYGYDVIDLGKDVAPEVIVDTAIERNIRLVGLSALMTTTVVSMEETIKLLRERKPDTKVIVGGAVLTQAYADMIGADAYGRDAMATVRYADSVFGKE